MARKRQKKLSDWDIAKAFTLLLFVAAYWYTNDLKESGFITMMAAIGVAAIMVVFYIYRQFVAQPASKTEKEYSQLSSANIQNTATNHDSKPASWTLDLIKSLDWKVFEELCTGYFRAKGRRAEVSQLGADGGIDIYLYEQGNAEKLLGVVQCKAWSKRPVGVKEIRELLGVMTDASCPLGVFITTSSYTADAVKFASGKHINLMDANKILDLILTLPDESQLKLLQQTTKGDYTTPSCPNCGIKLVSRRAKKGKSEGEKFWGCGNYPKCRYTMRQYGHMD